MPTPKKTDSKTASKEAAAPKKKCLSLIHI